MELLEIAKKLVGFNTVSQSESTMGIANFISQYCEDAGFKVEQYPYENAGLKKVNVVARKGGQDSVLCLSGHMDTVPFNTADWSTDPLSLTLRGGRFYGMGIADMKLFLAIAIKAGESVHQKKIKKPFSLCFTSDEEVGCLGARKLLKENVHLGRYVVIGEPTEMVPLNLHKGYMFIRIVLRGKTGHASTPDKGRSVVHLALSSVLQKIDEFRYALEGVKDTRFDPDYPTVNVGVVTTDDINRKSGKNLIADFCKIELEIRPIPGQEPEDIFAVFKKVVEESNVEAKGIQLKIEFVRTPTPPMETDSSSLISKNMVEITGNKVQSVCFNTEGGVFNRSGLKSIICGPGSINQAHKANEFVDAKYWHQDIVDKYIRLIKIICC